MPMRRLADRFDQAAESCASMSQLRELLLNACHELGFSYFALLHHASLNGPAKTHLRIDNYPPDWTSELISRRLFRHDPVHLASTKADSAFQWRELSDMIHLGREQCLILERSREFGIGDGVTVPINVPGEPSASCSFAVRCGASLPRERLNCAELIGVHAFRAARRLTKLSRRSARPRLSRREVQCVRLVAAGKTDWEIAVILGIAHETAHQYIKRARRAYEAVTRAQLVALGLRDDWLTFEDVKDPRI